MVRAILLRDKICLTMLNFYMHDFLATRVNGVIPFWKYRMQAQVKLVEVAKHPPSDLLCSVPLTMKAFTDKPELVFVPRM